MQRHLPMCSTRDFLYLYVANMTVVTNVLTDAHDKLQIIYEQTFVAVFLGCLLSVDAI